MKRRCMVVVGWVVTLSMLLPAGAARYDLSLGRFFSSQCTGTCPQENFENLMTDLGLATGPVFLAPAETLGLNGFSFGLEGTVVPISSGKDYWDVPTEGSPQSTLFIPHIHVRKGLPFSFELGANLSYLPESELFNVGAELKWAMNEGFYYIPDLAIRFTINHMVGSKDFELTAGGWDVSISHAFGLGGMLSLTPYAGYNMLFIHASSHVVLPQDLTAEDQVFSEMSWQDNMHHRLFIGCRLTTFIFQIIFEGVFHVGESLDRSAGLPVPDVSHAGMFSFKLGFDY